MLRITLRQFETFAVVAETGSVTGAASRLGVSPAAVSDQIRVLERKLGHRLFDRRPGTSPLLNDRGVALLRKVPTILESASAVAALATDCRTKAAKKIRIGAGNYILHNLILPNLAKFQRDYPDTYVEVRPLQSQEEAARQISAGHIDLAYITTSRPAHSSGVQCLGKVELCLVASPRHPVAKRPERTLRGRLPMLMPLAGSWIERRTLHILSRAGIRDFDIVTRAQHVETLISLAVNCAGVACVLMQHVASELDKGTLIALPIQLPPAHRHVIRRADAFIVSQFRPFDKFALELLRSGTGSIS